MKREEILIAAVAKAVTNGYDGSVMGFHTPLEPQDYYHIIFSDEFALAFWGRGKTICRGCGRPMDGWLFHLQEMALANDKLAYLKKGL